MDLPLIKGCMQRKTYDLLKTRIPYEVVGSSTRAMLQWVGAYFTANPEVQYVTPEILQTYVKVRMQDKLGTPGVDLVLELCERLKHTPSPDVPTLLNMLLERDFAGRLGALYVRYEQGHEIDFYTEVETLAKEYSQLRGLQTVQEYSLEAGLAEIKDGRGVQLGGMAFLSEYIAPFQGGTSIAFAARPDMGKTSWLCYTLTRSAKSIMDYFGADRPILHCINEGEPSRIPVRLGQAALGATISELFKYQEEGTLTQRYEEALGTPADYIKPTAIAGWDFVDLERKIEDTNPSVVVVDMLEHVGMPNIPNKAERTTEQWIKIRELAIIHNFVAISTVQVGFEGANNLFPTYDHLNYSKTGIQAATDIIIMMGALTGPTTQHVRGFSTAKNKFSVEGKPSLVEVEAVFDKDRSTFNDGVITLDEVENE